MFVDPTAWANYRGIKGKDLYLEKGLKAEDMPQFVKEGAENLKWEHLCVPHIPVLTEF